MKLITHWLLLVVMSILGMVHAEENRQLLIGQVDHRGESKVAFVLELVGNDLDYVINEYGELYVKVDRIIALPKDSLLLENNAFPSNSARDANAASLQLCGNRIVEMTEKKWKCPYCYRWWKLGEECKNEECPTNQWKKSKQS